METEQITLHSTGDHQLAEILGLGYVDNSFFIKKGHVDIGHVHTNRLLDGTLFIEWIELYPMFRGQHLFRTALVTLMDHFNVPVIQLEANDSVEPIYVHLGAQRIEYDDMREMATLALTKEAIVQ